MSPEHFSSVRPNWRGSQLLGWFSLEKESPTFKTLMLKYIVAGDFVIYRWWNQQDENTQNKVRYLVNQGQLEFVNAGWSMYLHSVLLILVQEIFPLCILLSNQIPHADSGKFSALGARYSIGCT